MAYIFLSIAVASEIAATSLLKFTEGFTRLWATLGCLAMYGVAFVTNQPYTGDYGLYFPVDRRCF